MRASTLAPLALAVISFTSTHAEETRVLQKLFDRAPAQADHFVPEDESLRLIETEPGKSAWMNPNEIHRLSRAMHLNGKCPGFMDITDHRDVPAPMTRTLGLFNDVVPNRPEAVEPLLAEISAEKMHATVAFLSSYHSRYYASQTGVQAAHWIRDRFVEYASGRTDIKVSLFNHSWAQPSVVARIEGSGPNANERIVIGGHEDSINQGGFWPDPNAQAPGADDNASGTATVLEVFRVLAQSGYRPNRTIEFMTYAAEEIGLKGSQAISRQYRDNGVNVVAALQFDMTMFPGQSRSITFINDFVDRELTNFLEMLVDEYVKVPWKEDACGYACSDHASWNRAGYASAFPFEAPNSEMNKQIHTTRDTQAQLDAEFGSHFARLGVAFAVELGSKE